MFDLQSSPDFPLSLISREAEISQASDVAATNEHVRRFFEAIMNTQGCFCVEINGHKIILESPTDVDTAYRLFLASPQPIREYRQMQAQSFLRDGKLHLTAA